MLVEDPSAADVLNELSVSHLARIFRVYGEERFARRIANAVVEYRGTLGPLRTTTQLADLVASVVSPLEYRSILSPLPKYSSFLLFSEASLFALV